jgi:hypothetical protein
MRRESPGTVAICDDGMWAAEFGISLATLRIPPGSRIIRCTGTHIAEQRNRAVQLFIGEWLAFIDTDHEFGPDSLVRLLSWNVPVVSALNIMRMFPFFPVAFLDAPRPTRYLHPSELPSDGLLEVGTTGCGMVLIRRYVIEDIKKLMDEDAAKERADLKTLIGLVRGHLFEAERDDLVARLEEQHQRVSPKPVFAMGQIDIQRSGEDTWFGFNAKRAGHAVYVDCGLRPGHKTDAMAMASPECARIRLPGLVQLSLELKYAEMSKAPGDARSGLELPDSLGDPEAISGVEGGIEETVEAPD